jgi:hypothetical protein
MAEILGQFAKGAAIPSWLFDIEPTRPDMPRARLFFTCDCALVETVDSIYVIAERVDDEGEGAGFEVKVPNAPPVSGDGYKCAAGTKPVRFPYQSIVVAIEGTDIADLPKRPSSL